jgi:hypothetical protein
MGPSNHHQLTMAIATDKISTEGRLSRSAACGGCQLPALHNVPSDSEFLVNYILADGPPDC